MVFPKNSRTEYFWFGRVFCLILAIITVLLLPFGKDALAAEGESVQHYKMLSTIEYEGKGQYRSEVETLFTSKKQFLSDEKVRYSIFTNDFGLVGNDLSSTEPPSSSVLSFVIDRKTKHLSEINKDTVFFEKINNECVKSLKTVTKENVGKTWKQSFSLPFLSHLFTGEMQFTLTAIQLKTEVFNEDFTEMIAVRALSEPFVVNATGNEGATGAVKARINAVYLFDPEIEDIYLSISVFEARTKLNGFDEKLRYEIATYKSNAEGESVALSSLGKKFEKLVSRLGLTQKSLEVVDETPLPQWVRYEGSAAAQVGSMCAAMACEGAPNPVVTVCIPAARTVALQSSGRLASVGTVGAISSALPSAVPAVNGLHLAAGKFLGVGAGTAAAIGGGAGVGIAAGGSSGGSSSRSTSSP